MLTSARCYPSKQEIARCPHSYPAVNDLASASRRREAQARHVGDAFFDHQEAIRQGWEWGTKYPQELVVSKNYFAVFSSEELIARRLNQSVEQDFTHLLADCSNQD